MVLYKEIEGHNSAYLIGSDGTVFNQKTGRFLKPAKQSNGYLHVTLGYENKVDCMIHRLVAKAFIPNPDNLPCVNHKDENKTNNHIENLEWCTQQYNLTYGKCATSRNSPVVQMDKEGKLIRHWASMKEASEKLKVKYQGISNVCRGLRKTCGGFCWEYREEDR